MNKKNYILSFFLLFSVTLWSQQLPLFTQNREYHAIINPASVNNDYFQDEKFLSFGMSYRAQWERIEGHPVTQVIRAEYIHDGGKVNLLTGGYILNDQAGSIGSTGAYGRIAGIVTDDPYYGGLSLGFNVGAVQYRINADEFRPRDNGDFTLFEQVNKTYPDVGFGAFFYKRLSKGWLDDDVIYGGLSVPQIFNINSQFSDTNGNGFGIERLQHFYGLLGLYKYTNEDRFIEPSVWIKYTSNAPLAFDFNLRYLLVANYGFGMWIGTGISTNGKYHIETGVRMGEDNRLKIGYAYDYAFTTFGPVTWSTHELNVSYAMGYKGRY